MKNASVAPFVMSRKAEKEKEMEIQLQLM